MGTKRPGGPGTLPWVGGGAAPPRGLAERTSRGTSFRRGGIGARNVGGLEVEMFLSETESIFVGDTEQVITRAPDLRWR